MTRRYTNVFTVTGQDIEVEKVIETLRQEHPFIGFAPKDYDNPRIWVEGHLGVYDLTNPQKIEEKAIHYCLRFKTKMEAPINLLYWMTSMYQKLNFKLRYYSIEERIHGDYRSKQGRVTRGKVWSLGPTAINQLKLEGVWDESLSH